MVICWERATPSAGSVTSQDHTAILCRKGVRQASRFQISVTASDPALASVLAHHGSGAGHLARPKFTVKIAEPDTPIGRVE